MPKVQVSHIYKKIQTAFDSGYTTISEQGSSRSAKTTSSVIWLCVYAQQHPNTSISIVRETLPALKGSVLRDFVWVMRMLGFWNGQNFKKGDLIYEFENGSYVEFFSCSDEQRLRGRKRNILFVNEANELSFLEWQQLQMRTTMLSILDYNPSFTEEHWINQVNKEGKTFFFISTYKDNPFLEQKVIDEIESLQWKNPSLWRVYGLGLQAIIEGLVFETIEEIDEIPFWAKKRKRFLGMDLGYSSDPTAIVEVCITEDVLYIDEICYQTKMLTSDIVDVIKDKVAQEHYKYKVISESADPRLIDEIFNAGIDIHPVHKYGGSILAGINKMKEYKLCVTKRSVNIIKEFKNYTYRKDKNGNWLNEPADCFNHCFTADTQVLTADGEKRIADICVGDEVCTSAGLREVTNVFNQGVKDVYCYRLKFKDAVIELEATKDHRIKTDKGWKQLQELQSGDALYLNTSSSMVRSMGLPKITITEQQPMRRGYQKQCGNTIMGNSRLIRFVFLLMGRLLTQVRRISGALQLMSYETCIKIRGRILKVKSSTGRYIIDTKESVISHADAKDCIVPYGNTITERFQKVAISTIRMKIQTITTSRIWNFFNPKSICRFMGKNIQKMKICLIKCERIWQKHLYAQKNGIVQRKAVNGIPNMRRKCHPIENTEPLYVKYAERNFKRTTSPLTEIISAQTTVSKNGEGCNIQMTRSGCANYVGKSLSSISMQKINTAEEAVLESITAQYVGKKVTYDIEVAELHEFFANGILVHNCIDAIRYIILEEILGKNSNSLDAQGLADIL